MWAVGLGAFDIQDERQNEQQARLQQCEIGLPGIDEKIESSGNRDQQAHQPRHHEADSLPKIDHWQILPAIDFDRRLLASLRMRFDRHA